MKSLEWALIQCDWCPYKERVGHRQAQREDFVRTQGEEGHRQAKDKPQKEPAGLTHPRRLASRTVRTRFLLFQPPGCGAWLRLPERTAPPPRSSLRVVKRGIQENWSPPLLMGPGPTRFLASVVPVTQSHPAPRLWFWFLLVTFFCSQYWMQLSF